MAQADWGQMTRAMAWSAAAATVISAIDSGRALITVRGAARTGRSDMAAELALHYAHAQLDVGVVGRDDLGAQSLQHRIEIVGVSGPPTVRDRIRVWSATESPTPQPARTDLLILDDADDYPAWALAASQQSTTTIWFGDLQSEPWDQPPPKSIELMRSFAPRDTMDALSAVVLPDADVTGTAATRRLAGLSSSDLGQALDQMLTRSDICGVTFADPHDDDLRATFNGALETLAAIVTGPGVVLWNNQYWPLDTQSVRVVVSDDELRRSMQAGLNDLRIDLALAGEEDLRRRAPLVSIVMLLGHELTAQDRRCLATHRVAAITVSTANSAHPMQIELAARDLLIRRRRDDGTHTDSHVAYL